MAETSGFGMVGDMLGRQVRAGVNVRNQEPSFALTPEFLSYPTLDQMPETKSTFTKSVGAEMAKLNNAQKAIDAAKSTPGFMERWGLNKKASDFGKDMTVGQTLALGAASTGLQMAGELHDIKAREKDALNQIKDEFDLRFGSQEFDGQRLAIKQEHDSIDQMLAILDNIDAQASEVPAQTLQSQQQTFIRNPT